MSALTALLAKLTMEEAAEALHTSLSTLYRMKNGSCVNCSVVATAVIELNAVDYAREHLETSCQVYQALNKKTTLFH